ncbi:MAG: hypothetical protein CMM95_01885 [Rickettsiales bacterium]|nr:hypothetical protein [Rickettsiales bacterium]
MKYIPLFIMIPFFLFAKIEIISVETEGIGISKKSAIDSALVDAVSQVNGAEIASDTRRQLLEVATDEELKSNETLNQEVISKTSGIIKSWKILSESIEGENHLVKLSVKISKLKKSAQSDRIRFAVVPFRATDSLKISSTVSKFEESITSQLENFLTQTRRFALIDRSFLTEQTKELNLIASGNSASMSQEEIFRLGNRLGTDYLIVGRIEKASSILSQKKSKVSDTIKKNLVSSAKVTIRIIDVATSQIKFADTYEKNINSSIERLAEELAFEIGEIVLTSIYPIRILNASSSQVVLGQGGKTLNKGDIFKVYQLGKELIDPYTKESLGREEIEVAVIQINNVKPKTSDAKILESLIDLSQSIANDDSFIIRPFKKANYTTSKKKKEKPNKLKKLKKELEEEW